MKKYISPLAGILFFILFASVITLIPIRPAALIPSRSTLDRKAALCPVLGHRQILTQGFLAKNNYLNRIDLLFTQSGRTNTNENVLLLLDSAFRVIHRETFSSQGLPEGDIHSVLLKEPVYVGRGSRLYLSLYSPDGTETNNALPFINLNDSIGPAFITNLQGDDPVASIQSNPMYFKGCLMMQTYTTMSSQFWFLKYWLYALAAVVSFFIGSYSRLRKRLAGMRMAPEWIYAGIALPFSLAFALITPPTQVPDSGTHLSKAYQISELQFFNRDKTIPVSLGKMDSVFGKYHDRPDLKLTYGEVLAQAKVKLEPEKRKHVNDFDYTVPYLPQALGIAVGRIVAPTTLGVLISGRIFNLLAGITLIFFAIRLIPSFKWLLMLLALMPKTVFLFGSMTYDNLTICLTFLAIALFLHYAYAVKRELGLKDLGFMALVIFLLLLCKPPYFLVGLLFFFIPPQRFGKWYKYILISAGVLFLAAIVIKGIPMMKGTTPDPQKHYQFSSTPENRLNATDQMRYIRSDLRGYTWVMLKSIFVHERTNLIEGFYGLLGWVDIKLPMAMTYAYLLFILLCALVLADPEITIDWKKKLLLFLILSAVCILVETAMYIYATKLGRDRIFGIQGRYFIPIAPLFFILFYNRTINPKLNLLFSPRRNEYRVAKPKGRAAILSSVLSEERIFDKFLYLVMACFSVLSLTYAVYMTLVRYYNIL